MPKINIDLAKEPSEEFTALTWNCPKCEVLNNHHVMAGEKLPDYLECCVCNHKSDKINWKKLNA